MFDHSAKTCLSALSTGLLLTLIMLALPEKASAVDAKESAKHGKHTGRVRNPPDIEATPAGELRIAQEVNLYSVAGISNTTVDYGLPDGWNIGVSFLNAQFYTVGPAAAAQPFEPDVLLNVEKSFQVWGNGIIVAGAQTGAGVLPQGAVLMNYSYLDFQWHWARWDVDTDVGAYYGNAALAGKDSVGWHVNIDVPIIDGLRLNGDYLSGQNGLSGAVVKLQYSLTPGWQVGLGVQIPTPNSGNDYSGLLGLYWH